MPAPPCGAQVSATHCDYSVGADEAALRAAVQRCCGEGGPAAAAAPEGSEVLVVNLSVAAARDILPAAMPQARRAASFVATP